MDGVVDRGSTPLISTKQVKRGCKKVPYFIDFLCKILYNIFKCNFFIPYSLISGGKLSTFSFTYMKIQHKRGGHILCQKFQKDLH